MDLEQLTAGLAANTDLKASAEQFVNAVADRLDSLTQDPVAIKQLANDLRHAAPGLGAALCENTQPTATKQSVPDFPVPTSDYVPDRQPAPRHKTK